jgi:hypothetical protein
LLNGSLFSLDPAWWQILAWNRDRKEIVLTEDDWRERVRLLRRFGMDTIVVQFAVQEGRSFYPSALFPPRYGKDDDPIGAILDESTRCGIGVYMPLGSLAPSYRVTNDLTDLGRLAGTRSLIAELCSRYGRLKSFAGWFVAEEPQKGLAEGREYLAALSRLAHEATPDLPVICAPHIQNEGLEDPGLLRELGVDIWWVQVLAERCGPEAGLMRRGAKWADRLAGIRRVRKACEAAGKRFWAEYEIFDFDETGRLLKPCGLERLRWQLPGLAELAEKIVVCGIPGLMEDPAATHPLGDKMTAVFFCDYGRYLGQSKRANHRTHRLHGP